LGWAAPTFLLDYTAVIAGTATEPTLYLIESDHLGVPVALYDEAGLKVWEHKRMPFGAPNGQPTGPLAATLTTALTLPGQYTDPVSLVASVTDNWMRTYNPQLGRYLQPDPIGLAGGLNRYAYVGGDPVHRIDPRGEHGLILWPHHQYGKKEKTNEVCISDPDTLFPLPVLPPSGGGDDNECEKAKNDARRAYNDLTNKRIPHYLNNVRRGTGDDNHLISIRQKQTRLQGRLKVVAAKCVPLPPEYNEWMRVAYPYYSKRH